MKKIMIFVATCVALAACTKDIDTTTSKTGDANAFEKGQQVTLSLNAGEQTKVSSELVTSGTDKDKVNFKWETGDKIKITVGTESAEFTLKSGAGQSTATFEGTMPAAGNTFDAQYPVTEPDLTSQTYVANGLPKDKMKMAATNCTIANNFTLTPQNAALRLNLYGGAREVSQIVVTGSSSATYTLSISSAVTVGKDKDNATPFFIVLPASESFVSAAVTANAITATTENTPTYTEGTFSGAGIPLSASTTLTPTETQSLIAGGILNMPAVSLTTVWAPVNCGYEATDYPYGLLYQWGRKYGQGYYKVGDDSTPTYEDADYPGKAGGNQSLVDSSSPQTSHPDGVTYNGNFYHDSSNAINNWYGGSDPDKLWNSNEGTSDPVSKSGFDPCPEGWRVPTESELTALMGSHTEGALQDGSGIYSGMKGMYFDGSSTAVPTSGLFLPAAGCRYCNSGIAFDRGIIGYYWSSAVDNGDAWCLAFRSGYATVYDDYRAGGYSVRCVQE